MSSAGETRTAQNFWPSIRWVRCPLSCSTTAASLAQSNAIIRYLARGSALLPDDPYLQAKIDEWLFWEQYSHEPYIAVCRYQMKYLGKRRDEA